MGIARLSPAGAVRRWLADREHRLDLLDPAWRDIGVGALHELSVPGVYGGRETTIITVDFGVRS